MAMDKIEKYINNMSQEVCATPPQEVTTPALCATPPQEVTTPALCATPPQEGNILHVQGVIKKNNDGSLNLIMTLRRKFADVFWFTLFHEIGHIINGDIEDRLIDYEDIKNELEDRADEFGTSQNTQFGHPCLITGKRSV
ncbi:MAG: hypothetical protein KGZ45_05480 [Clostridium sp.]|nr:hypothetical protein [Clostridium sp.]